MKPIFIFSLFFLSLQLTVNTLSAQNFIWARQALIKNPQKATITSAALLNSDGSCYFSGTLDDSLAFDSGTIYKTGYGNTFLAKYDATGKNIQLCKSAGTGYASPIQSCKDNNGNIYLIGEYEGNQTFGSYSITGDVGIFSYFIAKVDNAGNFIWAKTLKNYDSIGYYDVRVQKIACDHSGNLYVYGYSDGNYILDNIPINSSNGRIFLAKLSSTNGGAQWVQQAGGTAYNFDLKITTDNNDNVIIGGAFGYGNYAIPGLTCIFNGSDTLFTATGTMESSFIAKYSTTGNYQWSRQIGNFFFNETTDLATDSANNIYLAGTLGDSSQGNYYSKYFVSKYTPAGQLSWRNFIYGELNSMVYGNDGLYFHATMQDSFAYTGYSQVLPGVHSVIIKTDTSGNIKWHTEPFDYNASFSYLSASENGTLLLSGIGMPKIKLGNSTLYNGGRRYDFLALISDSSFTPAAHNTITGNIFDDQNADCIRNISEPGLAKFGVIAQPGPYYGVADATGNYSIKVNNGTYNIRQLIPYGHRSVDTVLCQATGYSVTMGNVNQTVSGYDFANQYTHCSLLNVTSSDQYYGNLLNCNMTKTTQISVCNYGSDTAHNVIVHVKYPGDILLPLSSFPVWSAYNTADTSLTFTLGNIAPDSCFTINIADTVICSSIPANSWDIRYVYKINVTPQNTCYPEDSIYTIDTLADQFVIPLSIPNVAAHEETLRIFPNPSSGKLMITGTPASADIKVYDLVGRLILTTKTSSGETILDLSGQIPGIYIIQVKDTHGMQVRKVVKE